MSQDCGCPGSKTTYQVVTTDGRIRKFATETEAKAAADATGGELQIIKR